MLKPLFSATLFTLTILLSSTISAVAQSSAQIVPTAVSQPRRTTQRQIRHCNKRLCIKPKGELAQIQIVEPATPSMVARPSVLRWDKINGAVSYQISVSGHGHSWYRLTTDNMLPYPQDTFTLKAGNAYLLTILAKNAEGKVIAETNFPLNLMREEVSLARP
jgi:hypothetical protein